MNGKIISSVPVENDTSYRVEIYEDDSFLDLVGEANVIGCGSFSRDRQYMNKTVIKRYAKSVANRRGVNFPWFISDELAQKYGITTELPIGISEDMKPVFGKRGGHSASTNQKGSNQASIDEFFYNSSSGFLAEERSVSPPPQFTFPCDDAVVPVELIDQDLKFPNLIPVNQFISDSGMLSRSLTIWSFCQTFSTQLKLTPFSYDDWEEAMSCWDEKIDSNPIVEETFLALLATLMKDRRNLTKGAYADKLKASVLTFKSEQPDNNYIDSNENNLNSETKSSESSDTSADADNVPEILIGSDSENDENESSEEESAAFVKRSLKTKGGANESKKVKSMLLPSIDLRKHRWYETRAMEYWHFVLGSCYLEVIDMISQFIAEEEAKEESSEGSDESEESSENELGVETDVNDSAYEDEADDDKDESEESEKSVEEGAIPKESVKQLVDVESPLDILKSFIRIYEPIVEELTARGSKEMFASYLNLSLDKKFALLEFLVHSHYDRDTFKAFVEECLERQADSRKTRKEAEIEARQALEELEKLEAKVSSLKEENLKITERLEAEESEIEMSDGDENDNANNDDNDDNDDKRDNSTNDPSDKSEKVPFEPLSEKERDELVEKRTINKKEINSLNATLRKLRPETTAFQRRSEAASKDLRKCSSFRTAPLGSDRHGREFWWFGEFVSPLGRILVCDREGAWMGAIDCEEGFQELLEWLNPLGIREAKLKANLLELETDIRDHLQARDLPPEKIIKAASVVDGTTAVDDESEEVDFEAFRRGRGRPPKGSTPALPPKRPFQKYKNTLA